jgi:outer membrane immunogenic protein
MHEKLLSTVAAVAIVTALAGPVAAADVRLPVKAAPMAPAPVPQFVNWSGFYIGGDIGYGWTKFDGGASEFVGQVKPNGGLIGVHAGYNWQLGPALFAPATWVFGIEGDINGAFGTRWSKSVFSGADNLSGVHGELNGLSSIRARLGWAFDRTLIYATGGAGWGLYKSGALATEPVPAISHTVFGGVVGGGIEWKYNPNLSFRLEGLHYFFNKNTPTASSDGGLGDTIRPVSVIRVGFSYHFGGDLFGKGKGPVVARY